MDVDVCDSLAMYPDVTSRLREEILEHVGPSRRPTYADIRDMKFLRAVINGGFSHISVSRNVPLSYLCRDDAALPFGVSVLE
jgi:hypothetical protein